MVRDPTALTVQGPDNFDGNPLIVDATLLGTSKLNLFQVDDVVVDRVLVAGLSRQRVAICDLDGFAIRTYQGGDTPDSLKVAEEGGQIVSLIPVANTAVVLTIPAVAGFKVRLLYLAYNFIGANAAVNLLVFDGAGVGWIWPVPAAQNALVSVSIPGGGAKFTISQGVVFTLPAGGVGVTGQVTAVFRYDP